MKFDVEKSIMNQAKHPHNLFMLNLALFHLLMTPAVIALKVGLWGIMLPLLLSLSVMLFTYVRSNRIDSNNQLFVFLHWKLALLRYRYLLISYAVTAVLMLVGWMLSMGTADEHMRNILQTVFIRIAIMPVLIMVMVNFYLESNAINIASSGEIPDSLVNTYAPSLVDLDKSESIDSKRE